MKTSKPVYELYHPLTYGDDREYVIIVHKDGKTYGYEKRAGQDAKRQHDPYTIGMIFVGYMKEEAVERKIFVDLL